MENDIRELWKQQSVPPIRLLPSDLRNRSRVLQRSVKLRTIKGLLASIIVAAFFAKLAMQVPDWPRRVGAALTALSAAYLIYQLLQGRMKIAATQLGGSASVDFYREELARQRDFHQGRMFWSRLAAMYPGYLLFCWGSAVADPPAARVFGWIAATALLLGGVGIVLNLRLARKYQRQIDEINLDRKKEN